MNFLAIDFDGTIVEHKYPEIGKPVPNAIESIKLLQSLDYKIILWTMRSGEKLKEAVGFLKSNGITLYGVNHNPAQDSWTSSPKAYAHFYVDDAAIGCPLIYPKNGDRHYVNWHAVTQILSQRLNSESGH